MKKTMKLLSLSLVLVGTLCMHTLAEDADKQVATAEDFTLHQGVFYVGDDLSGETVVTSDTVTNFTVLDINTVAARDDRSVTISIKDDPNFADVEKLDVGNIEIYSIMGASVSESSDTAFDEGNVNEGRYFVEVEQDESLANTFHVSIIAKYAMDEYKRPLTIYPEPWITVYTSFTLEEETINVLDLYYSRDPETDSFDAMFEKKDLPEGDDGDRDFAMWINTETESFTRYYATNEDGDNMITVNYTFYPCDVPYEKPEPEIPETEEPEIPEAPTFTDVLDTAYYYDAVLWAVENKITTGTSDTTFSPDLSCTRADAVSLIWRYMESPVVNFINPFADNMADNYAYEAILWGASEGIVNGLTETSFAPRNTCTRAQIVTFLYRLAGEPAVTGEHDFSDVAESHYAKNAIAWANELGITTGTGEDTFSPEKTCTRGEIVTFLYRYATGIDG